jgi:hypothetical protein
MFASFMKKSNPTEQMAMGVFVIAGLYAIVSGTPHTLLAGIAFVLIIVGALPKQIGLAFLVGGSVILLLQTNRKSEGFASAIQSGAGPDLDPTRVPSPAPVDKTGSPGHAGSPQGTGDFMVEEATEKEKDNDNEGFGNKRALLPDNTDRKEPLELGKAYKLPSEGDDKGFHLDSGTTFMNAYKALKPEQIAAMTKDTQELLATQKSLMNMLDSMKPLLSDGQNMMNMFGSYFGKNE